MSVVGKRMNMAHLRNNIQRGKIEVLGDKSDSVPQGPLQVSH